MTFAASAAALAVLACNSSGLATASQPPATLAASTAAPSPTHALATETEAATPSPTSPPEIVDEFIAACPSAAAVASLQADLELTFESDPSSGELSCTAADGSADLTPFQHRVIQSILVMKRIQFRDPLPWTDEPLYDWFASAVDGLRFRSDIENSFCCDPANVLDIQTHNIAALQTDRWIDPQMGEGVQGLMVLFVHEARHNEGFPHTCGTNDQSIAEMGAWGVQYHLYLALADAGPPGFLDAADPYPGYYDELSQGNADRTRAIRFCNEPTVTPGPSPTLRP